MQSLRAAAAQHVTLDTLVSEDAAAGRLKTQGSYARNLWRVLNALRFLRHFLRDLAPQEASLRQVAQTAYNDTMAATHIWPIRQAVWLALWASPSRAWFVETLATHGDHSAPEVEAAAARFVAASDVVIRRLDALYTEPCVDEHGN